MAIPTDVKIKLDPQDEYTHTPEAASNYNESMYFHGFDSKRQVGTWVRLGNRVNEGHAEMSCCVYLPDGRVGFMYQRPQITDNKAMSAGGMRFDVVEPFKHLKVAYAGDVLLLDRPLEMANPSAAFKSNPKAACSMELDFTGVSPMSGGEYVNLDGSPMALDPEKAVFRGHTEQHMAVRGRIAVGDQRFDIDGFGYRDKSWGPRFWNNFFWYKWLPVSFGPDFGVLLSVNGRQGDKPVVHGNVFANGRLNLIHEISVESEFDSNYYQKSLVARFRTDDREYVMEGKVVALIPLRHLRNLPNGEKSFAVLTEGLTQYTCDGRVSYGMSEYFDLIEDGRPISLKEKL